MPEVLPLEYNATFQQAQFLSNSDELTRLLKPEPGSTAARLLELPDAKSRVRTAFLAVYGRWPDEDESSRAVGFLNERPDQPDDAVRDLLWALLTSAEFLSVP